MALSQPSDQSLIIINSNDMEMRDPSTAGTAAEEQTLNRTPEAGVIDNQPDNESAPETVDGCDPEAVVEEEMTEAEDLQTEVEGEVTKEALLATAKSLSDKSPADYSSDDVRRLRQQYNTLRRNEVDTERAAWIEAGNAAADFVETEDAAGAEILGLLNAIKERKAAYAAEQEAQRADNLRRKNEIVDAIIALAEDTDNVNRTFPRYRELQDEFNAIGDVPPTDETAIWKRFQDARERYSDNLKINKELRDYDFKKNLDTKQLLLNEAEGLINEADVITAYRRLQELHIKWRRIGPVAKEIREDIWNRFKNASAEINKRYQAHFEARKAREAENEAGKTALCERIEAFDLTSYKTFNAWDEATKSVIETQNDWKKLGFASRKMNNLLFARFREACDKFFAAKAEFFKNTRDEFARNLAAKTALAERAEALKDSTDWRAATDEFVAMQKEWKTIGTVAKKHSDAVWQRFLAACDHFFEQKKKATSGVRRTESANLKAKRDVIARLDTIDAETPREEALAKLRELQDEWQQIGHVPFKEKDKVYEEYRTKVNALRDMLNVRENRARMNRFETAVSEIENDGDKLYRERERLLRSAEVKRNELRTYENNLGFLSSKSKSGDSMLREFQRKIERIKSDLEMIDEKVRLIDSKL